MQLCFISEKFEYLGRVLIPGRLATVSKNVDAIKTAVVSTNSIHMGSFLISCNVCLGFIEDLSKITRPLNENLQWSKILDFLNSMTEAQDAFDTLNSKLVKPSVFVLPQPL